MDKVRLATIEDRCTRTLIRQLAPLIHVIYEDLYNEVKKDKTVRTHMKLHDFQLKLKNTPVWNTIDIQKRKDTIIQEIPDLMDILEAVFMVNAQVWGSVHYGTKSANEELTLQLPTSEDFIHKIIIHGAEKIYKDPGLFDHRLNSNEIRNNRDRTITLIEESCHSVIDTTFPRGDILKKFMLGQEDIPDSEPETGSPIKSDPDPIQSDSDSDSSLEEEIIISDSESDTDSDTEENNQKTISFGNSGGPIQKVLPDPIQDDYQVVSPQIQNLQDIPQHQPQLPVPQHIPQPPQPPQPPLVQPVQ